MANKRTLEAGTTNPETTLKEMKSDGCDKNIKVLMGRGAV